MKISEYEKDKEKMDDRTITIYHNIDHPRELVSIQKSIENWTLYILATYGLYTLTRNIISLLSR